MSVISKEDLFARLQQRIGDDTSDETMAFVEDFTDTINDMSNQVTSTESDWKKKYEDNDNEWKKKYRDRFFTTPEKVKKDNEMDVKSESEIKDFDDLFKER